VVSEYRVWRSWSGVGEPLAKAAQQTRHFVHARSRPNAQATEAENKEDREIVCEEVFCDITGRLDEDARGERWLGGRRLLGWLGWLVVYWGLKAVEEGEEECHGACMAA